MRIEALGWLRARRTNGDEIELGGPLERRVLATLALRAGDVVSLDTLADAVFGEELTTSATIRLQNHISRLRKRLGPRVVVTTAPGYRLDADAVEVDWRRFEDLLAEAATSPTPGAAAELYARALSSWRGAPFGELEEWPSARVMVTRLEEERRVAQEEHAAALVASGRATEAVGLLEALVGEEPLRERRWGALMLALYRCGRQADAQRAFQRARSELAEIGLEPGSDLRTLDRGISVQDPALDREPTAEPVPAMAAAVEVASSTPAPVPLVRPSNLSRPVDTFIGREADLARLADAVAAHHLVTIFGVGGMGKTRLALEAADRVLGFDDGIWLAELGSVRAGSDVAPAVAAAIGLRTSAGTDLTEAIAEWCSRLDALIILDNCEHVLAGVAPLVTTILQRGPMSRLVATSREPVIVAGEHVLPLAPLSLEPDGDQPGDAVRLLVERASALRPDLDPTRDKIALTTICARLDGMPLAIELAAARFSSLSPAAVADRLDERFRLLTGGRRTAAERHKTLRATVDWSYELLNDDQRRLFERLSTFAGPFGLDDVTAIHTEEWPGETDHHDGALHEVELIDLLAELVDRSLVAVSNAELPYRLLETLRAYGVERLQGRGELDQVRDLHARWFAAKARRTRTDACGPAAHTVWRAAIAQVPDYQSAATWAIDHHDVGLGVAIPADLVEAFSIRLAVEFSTWGGPLAARVTGADPSVQARALWLVGCYEQFHVGDLAASGRTFEEALRLDPDNAFCHIQASIQGALTARLDEMHDQARTARAIAGDDPAATAVSSLLFANAQYFSGDEGARRSAEELLAWARARAWPEAVGHARYLLARIDAGAHPEQAEVEYREALRIAWQVESYSLASIVQIALVALLIDERPAAAPAAALDLVRYCRRQLEHVFVSQAIALAVMVLQRAGDLDRAAGLAHGLGAPLITNMDRQRYDDTVAALRVQLGGRFDDLAAATAGLSIFDLADEAIAALDQLVAAPGPSSDA